MKYSTRCGGQEGEFVFDRRGGRLVVRSGDRQHDLDVHLVGDGATFSLLVDGRSYDIVADIDGDQVAIQMVGERFVVVVEDERERAAHCAAGKRAGGRRELRAAMPGIVMAIKVAVGDQVAEGQTLVVLEAMKMQNPLAAEDAGRITRVACRPGEAVAAGALLLELE